MALRSGNAVNSLMITKTLMVAAALWLPPAVFAQSSSTYSSPYAPPQFAQYAPDAESALGQPLFSQQELDQMLAPIALYPDALLSQILMAATYPAEVSAVAEWSRNRAWLGTEDALRAVEQYDWDRSVKSLVAFPQVLAWMDENYIWTHRLGDAFLAQEPHLMDTVQALRQRAQAAGTLRSTDEMSVVQQGRNLVVMPVHSHLVYVPYYDPRSAFGRWWWPAAPPVYWAPLRGYPLRPGASAGFWWGQPSAVRPGFFFGSVDWRRRHVQVVNLHRGGNQHRSVQPPAPGDTAGNTVVPGASDAGAWRHDSVHRRGVRYPEEWARRQGLRTATQEPLRTLPAAPAVSPLPGVSPLPRAIVSPLPGPAVSPLRGPVVSPLPGPIVSPLPRASAPVAAPRGETNGPRPSPDPREQSRAERHAVKPPEQRRPGGGAAIQDNRPAHDARPVPQAQRHETHREESRSRMQRAAPGRPQG